MPWWPWARLAKHDRAAHVGREWLRRCPLRGRPLGTGRLFKPPDRQGVVGQHFLIGGGFRRGTFCEDMLHA